MDDLDHVAGGKRDSAIAPSSCGSVHTPGPWASKKIFTGSYHIQAGEQVVAHAGYEDRAEANARLIAAAPDLLAALQGLLDGFSDYVGPNINAARAAIAKATGANHG